jgi:ketosteroid isomerase-like protein
MGADPIDAPETFFSQFTEDVYWVYSDQTPWVGMQGLRSVKWCHTLSAEITADRVEGSGDLAYARGTYRLSLDCGGDAPVDTEGVFLSAHRRQQDGSWRIESLLQHD